MYLSFKDKTAFFFEIQRQVSDSDQDDGHVSLDLAERSVQPGHVQDMETGRVLSRGPQTSWLSADHHQGKGTNTSHSLPVERKNVLVSNY